VDCCGAVAQKKKNLRALYDNSWIVLNARYTSAGVGLMAASHDDRSESSLVVTTVFNIHKIATNNNSVYIIE